MRIVFFYTNYPENNFVLYKYLCACQREVLNFLLLQSLYHKFDISHSFPLEINTHDYKWW